MTALLGKALGEALARTLLPPEDGAAGNAKSKGKEQDFQPRSKRVVKTTAQKMNGKKRALCAQREYNTLTGKEDPGGATCGPHGAGEL